MGGNKTTACWLLAALVLGLQVPPAQARRPQPPAWRLVREGKSYQAVLKVRTMELPAYAWIGRKVQVREGSQALVRTVTRDAPVKDGKFQRTVRTLTLLPKTRGKVPWAREEGDYTPKWSRRKADHLFSSKQLGPLYDHIRGRVKVRLFAPRAAEVYLVVEQGKERIRMAPDRSGVWEAELKRQPKELYGKAYHFEVDGRKVADPHSHLTGGDYGPSVFADLRYAWTDQKLGKGDVLAKLIRRGVAEVHVKDMTAHSSSPVDHPSHRGTYRGLASEGVREHYRELGVAGLELMPVQEYDDKSGDKGTFNHWGYMPTFFGAPEGRYGTSRGVAHRELQGAINALHRDGKSVIMDVVYNHTAKGDQLHLRLIGRDFYYRVQPEGKDHDGAGCGNELASERPMVRKHIIDTLRHFVDNYHVDGFRFDLGALLDIGTMKAIDRALPRRIFLTAEPWAALPERARWGKRDVGQGDLRCTRFTLWNDDFREAGLHFMKGGAGSEWRDKLINAVAGSVPYGDKGWASRPSQVVNYLESHDEHTLADRFQGDKRRVFMGNVLLLTSQGVPMLAHGQEMMRTKKDIRNAHNQDNEVSWLDWKHRSLHADLFEATAGLIELRAALPHFQYEKPLTSRDIYWLTPDNTNGLGYRIRPPRGTKGRRAQPDVLVLHNSDPHNPITFDLSKVPLRPHEQLLKVDPAQVKWRVVVDGASLRVDPRGLGTFTGTYRVFPGTSVVLIRHPD